MASVRAEILLDRPAAEVWAYVGDPSRIAEWFPGIEAASVQGATRTITLTGGGTLDEEIVTLDGELRRFQYRIVGGVLPVDSHLGTVDVLDAGGRAMVVYGTDVTPDAIGPAMGRSLAAAVAALGRHFA